MVDRRACSTVRRSCISIKSMLHMKIHIHIVFLKFIANAVVRKSVGSRIAIRRSLGVYTRSHLYRSRAQALGKGITIASLDEDLMWHSEITLRGRSGLSIGCPTCTCVAHQTTRIMEWSGKMIAHPRRPEFRGTLSRRDERKGNLLGFSIALAAR